CRNPPLCFVFFSFGRNQLPPGKHSRPPCPRFTPGLGCQTEYQLRGCSGSLVQRRAASNSPRFYPGLTPGALGHLTPQKNLFLPVLGQNKQSKRVQLLAVDHSARASMKNAASCEN